MNIMIMKKFKSIKKTKSLGYKIEKSLVSNKFIKINKIN
jgi:hypothetical protein